MNIYKFARFVVAVIFKPLYRVKVEGADNIPSKGPVIICSNHISNLDPPIVGITNHRNIYFMAKEELFEKKFLKILLNSIQAFPIKRGMRDRNALRKGLKVLNDGHALGLFPEGTRSKTGEIGRGLAGAGFFALRSDAVVIPCAIVGDYTRKTKLRVVYGKAIPMDNLRREKKSPQEVTDVIMEEIKKIKENALI